MSRSRRFPAGILAALTLLLVVRPAGVAAEQPLRIAGGSYLGDLPTMIAQENNLFARHGVATDVSYTDSGATNLELLRAGETDLAVMTLTPLVLDALRDDTPGGDDDPVILANMVHSSKFNQLVTFERSGIQTPDDLRGRRLGLQIGTNAEFAWWLTERYFDLEGRDNDGLENRAVTLVDMPIDALEDALIAGDIDAAAMWNPWTDRLRQDADQPVITLPGSEVYGGRWVLVCRRGLAQSSADRIDAVLRAYLQAVDDIEDNPSAALERYAFRFRVKPSDVAARAAAVDYTISLDWSLVVGILQQLEWARETRPLLREQSIRVSSLIDTAPLRRVAPAAVGLPPAVSWSEQAAP